MQRGPTARPRLSLWNKEKNSPNAMASHSQIHGEKHGGAPPMKFGSRTIARGKRLIKCILRKDVWSVPEVNVPSLRLGSTYGGWTICTNVGLGPDSVIYSVGVGEDISFDLDMIETFRCQVFAFDPTPRSINWLKTQHLPSKFQFFPWGLAAIDGHASFAAPEDLRHVSFSSAARTGHSVQCEVYRLSTLMRKLRHEKIDLLKMDIEGSEYDVIKEILNYNLRPRQLLTEFHHGLHGITLDKTATALQSLNNIGYRIFSISPGGREYSFVLRSGGR
jgi:FkbM family methyltransferase